MIIVTSVSVALNGESSVRGGYTEVAPIVRIIRIYDGGDNEN